MIINELIEKELKEFSKRFVKFIDGKGIYFIPPFHERVKPQEVKLFIREFAQKLLATVKEEIKSGKICLNCFGEKEGNLTDMCSKCLEEE